MKRSGELLRLHKAYLKSHGSFHIDCSLGIFDQEEREILEKYGHWFQALQSRILEPFTERQKRFIQVALGLERPFSVEEWAWFKYINRKRIEAKYSERLKAFYVPEDDTFYSREMVKTQRRMMFGVVKKEHNR